MSSKKRKPDISDPLQMVADINERISPSTEELLSNLGINSKTYHLFKDIKIFQCTICWEEFSLGPDWEYQMLNHFKENHLESFINIEQEDYIIEEIVTEDENTGLNENLEVYDEPQSDINLKQEIQTEEFIESENPLECKHCSLIFKNKLSFDKHSQIHEFEKEEVQDQAEDSENTESDNDEKKIELVKPKQKKDYKCTVCNTNWKTNANLMRHIKTHNDAKERKFECTICSKKFTCKGNLDEHVLLHFPAQFHCKICSRSFYRHNDFRRHMQEKHSLTIKSKRSKKDVKDAPTKEDDWQEIYGKCKDFTCKYCSKSFQSSNDLQNHLKSEHEIDDTNLTQHKKLYTCEICSKEFTKQAILNHLRSHSLANELRFECLICAKRFRTEKNLIDHKIVHRPPKFLCEYCNKFFHRKTELKRHLAKSHSQNENLNNSDSADLGSSFQDHYNEYVMHEEDDVKNLSVQDGGMEIYQCTICDLPTRFNRLQLIKHMNTHNQDPERKFVCRICFKCFKYKGNLEEHRRLHRPAEFPCEMCEREFYRHNDLRRHLYKAHKIEIPGIKKQKKNDEDDDQAAASEAESNTEIKNEAIDLDDEEENSQIDEEENSQIDEEENYQIDKEENSQIDEEEEQYEMGNDSVMRTDDIIIKEHDYAENDSSFMSIKTDNEENRKYDCDKCRKTFKYKGNLDEHKLHHLPPEFVCSFCEKGFYRHNDLRRHMDQKHKIQIVAKRSIESRLLDESDVHAIEYLDEDDEFIEQKVESFEEEDNERAFACDECDKRYKYKGNLDEHKLIHRPPQFKCDFCSKGLYRHNDLRRHLMQKHKVEIEGKRKNPNESSQSAKKAHVEELLRCKICDVSEKFNKENFIEHMKIHENAPTDEDEKKFQCEQCPKKYRVKRHLDEHKLLHQPPKFPCEICTKGFFRHNDFRRHMHERHDIEVESLRSLMTPKTRMKKEKIQN